MVVVVECVWCGVVRYGSPSASSSAVRDLLWLSLLILSGHCTRYHAMVLPTVCELIKDADQEVKNTSCFVLEAFCECVLCRGVVGVVWCVAMRVQPFPHTRHEHFVCRSGVTCGFLTLCTCIVPLPERWMRIWC